MGERAPVTDVNLCHVPRPMPAEDAAAYAALREVHCEQKRESHECAGRVTIDRNGVTLSCPLCGDARSLYPARAGAHG